MIEPRQLKLQKKEHNRRYKAAHRDEIVDSSRKYYAANREKVKESSRRWSAAHPERKKDNARRWDVAHSELSKERNRLWRAANPERAKEYKRQHALKKYSLTPRGYDAILEAQGGVCAVCKRKPGKLRLAIDHCHTTGVVRGLLCTQCNTTIGMHFDSPQRLEALLEYVRKHSQLRLVSL